MPSTLLRISVFLAFLLLAAARPQDQVSQDQVQADAFAIGAEGDWASSGNYLIYSCGSKVPDVKNILDRTYLSLQTAILGTDSSAFKAFFHSADPSSMTAVLKAITAGTNITDPIGGSRVPTMVCANANEGTLWEICQQSEQTVIYQFHGTAIVVLCPVFFDRPLMPLSTECGTVNRANTALISHGYITGSQYGFLVQALADMYIQDTMRGNPPGADVSDLNACLALPPDRALKNPSSYAFYVSSKW